jgi:hypothetical protein
MGKRNRSCPAYSSNYYNATMYYARKNNWIRAALYGEIFLNLESYSKRTEEIKAQLLSVYNNLLAPDNLQQLKDAKTTSVFEKNVLEVLAKNTGRKKETSNIDDLVSVRTKFIVEWVSSKQKTYPFQLFSHQQYLLSQGLFGAYNYWLFSTEAMQTNTRHGRKNMLKKRKDLKRFSKAGCLNCRRENIILHVKAGKPIVYSRCE